MCVIAVYHKDLELNEKELAECFRRNPDGAGFMYFDEKAQKVHISKGYFTFDELWEKLEKLPTNIDRVIHFRIATSGAIGTSTCHPFPVCDDYKKMGFGDVYANIGLAHNGVMHQYTSTKGMKSKYSDTMQFIKTMVYPLGESLWLPQVQELLEDHVVGNKFAIIAKDQLVILGDFEQSKESHALYSNSSYKPYVFTNNTWQNYYFSKPVKQTSYDDFGADSYVIDDGYESYEVYPVELFTGKVDNSKIDDYIDEFYDAADALGCGVYDYKIKEYSIVFYVDDPTIMDGETIFGKHIMLGDFQYGKDGKL